MPYRCLPPVAAGRVAALALGRSGALLMLSGLRAPTLDAVIRSFALVYVRVELARTRLVAIDLAARRLGLLAPLDGLGPLAIGVVL